MPRSLLMLALLAPLCALGAPWASPAEAQTVNGVPTTSGVHDLQFVDAANPRVGQRRYALFIPSGYAHGGGAEHRLVLLLHGGGQLLDDFVARDWVQDMTARAEANDVILVAPAGFLATWNALHCCGFSKIYDLDDVGFIENLVGELAAELDVDEKHIHMVGFSNGGMMVHRLASESSDLFASGAAVASSPGGFLPADFAEPQCDPYDVGCAEWAPAVLPAAPAEPIPMMMIRGLADPSVPYDGGDGASGLAWHLPAVSNPSSPGDSGYEIWTALSGCTVQPVDVRPAGELRDCLAAGAGEFDVRMVSLTTMEHEFPTLTNSANFDGVRFVVEFLNQHPKP